ncbi:putative T7SS-secreted protein [Nocardia amamiensis]|uniref:putative T7SS-secreted protein n=1 Tax=Nocardia amamiensis TaxID=404578 RepID=UPI00082ED63B|nr:HYD1 signature containing ADP-ribosyltransferase family protein [Nocardia amamiensis]
MGIGFDNFLNSVGNAVEGVIEAGVAAAGQAADAGLDALASGAREVGADGVAESLDDLGDRIASATGGPVDERDLGETRDPKELIRGEPSAIHDAAETLRTMGTTIDSTGDALRRIDTANWTGSAADAFNAVFDKQPKLWWDGADAMAKAASALDGWYSEVVAAQAKAADAIAKWDDADAEERTKKNEWNALSDSQKSGRTLTDTWTPIRNAARDILNGARAQRDNAAAATASKLLDAASAAPTEPPFTERWSNNLSDLADIYQHGKESFDSGVLTSLSSMVQFVRAVNPSDTYNLTHPAEYLSSVSSLGTGLVVAAADPGAVVSSVVSDARRNPFEFAGSITGDALLTAATGGAGSAKAAATAVNKIDDAVRLTDRATELGTHTPTPAARDIPTPGHDTPAPDTQPALHTSSEPPSHPSTTNTTGDHRTEAGHPEAPPQQAHPDTAHTPDTGTASPHADQDSSPAPHPGEPEPARPRSEDSAAPTHPGPDPSPRHADTDTPAHPDADRPPAAAHPGSDPGHHADTDTNPPAAHHDSPGAADHVSDTDTHPGGHDQPAPHHDPHDGPSADPTPQQRAEADHNAYDRAQDSSHESDRTPEQKTCTDDPVDIATGEFLLPETDLDLPGVLPMVLRRTHRSNYRFGRWFGPSWSSTLDMRVVVEHQGVTFLGEDGIMLAYPHPEPGVAVQPVTGGQRWTLTRTDTGGYRVLDQRRELIWHFAPEPTLAGLESRLGNYAISAITDRHHNRIRFHYNTDAQPVAVSHSGGYRISIDTTAGRITALSVHSTNAGERPTRVREFGYEAGSLVTVRNGVGATMRYTYDDDHRLTSWTDSNGNQMVNTYDEAGRVVFQRGTGGVLNTDFAYFDFADATGRLTTVTNSLGAVTSHGFDRDLQLRDLIDPLGGRTRIAYNADRKPLHVTAADGTTTSYRYTVDGDIATLTRPDGRSLTVDYLWRNRPVSITRPDGTVWRQEWDRHANLIAAIDPADARTEYTYHPNGALATITQPSGARTLIEVDPAGLPIRVTDPHGAITRIERDAFGRPTAVTDPLGATTHYHWSPDGRLLQRTDPDQYTETWTYDGEGNALAHTNRAGETTRFSYGAFDLLATRTEPDGSTTRYTWDTERRLTTVTNPLGHTWSYTYDPAGRLIAETDYNGATTRYTHDPAGRVTTITPPTGITRHQTHDPLGRLTEIASDTGDWVRYTHDPAGRILTAATGINENVLHTLAFTYTPTGAVATQQLDDRPVTRHEYDHLGRRIRRTSPTGATSTWTHDLTGRVRSLTTGRHQLSFSYDPLGRLASWQTGEIAVALDFTAGGRLAHQTVTAFPATSLDLDPATATRPSQRLLRHDEYAYRPDGYLTHHTLHHLGAQPQHHDYRLDALGRVTTITHDHAATERYTYDPLSNITSAALPETVGTEPAPPHAASHHRVDPAAGREYRGNLLIRDGRTRYHYDAAGRLIRKTTTRWSRKPDIWRYRYNSFDQLTDVWTPDQQWWHYTYDGLGRRTTKQHLDTDGTVLERVDYTWDGTRLIEQTSSDTTTRWEHQPGSHTPITQTTDQTTVDREFYAIITDLVGTPTELIDPTNAYSAATATTDLWGRTQWSGHTDTPLRYPGQIHDPETGLHYNLHRTYDPATGRYLTPDPLGLAASPNPSTYPHNPTTRTDPLGLIPNECANTPPSNPHSPAPADPTPGTAPPQSLYHYTNETGHDAILESQELRPSLRDHNPKDARYGDGQYLTDIEPGTRTPAQLSAAFLRVPWAGQKFSHFLEIDVTGLTVIQGRPGVFVIPNTEPLDLSGRIIRSGRN